MTNLVSHKHLLLMFSFLAGIAAATDVANGQRIGSKDIEHSVWDTTYRTRDGDLVRATVVFDGGKGYYDTRAGRGRLRNIQYRVDKDPNTGRFAALIEGDWSLGGGAGGSFRFNTGSANRPLLDGSYDLRNVDNFTGTWTGTFVRRLQPNVGGGGVSNGGGSGGSVKYGPWSYHETKGYYYRPCYFPAGGHQYLIYYHRAKPNWVYWFNPEKRIFWCACPTVLHPSWGDDIRAGKDLFLLAGVKARNVGDCEFPRPNDLGDFVTGSATDQDGSTVNLDCPPPDLP